MHARTLVGRTWQFPMVLQAVFRSLVTGSADCQASHLNLQYLMTPGLAKLAPKLELRDLETRGDLLFFLSRHTLITSPLHTWYPKSINCPRCYPQISLSSIRCTLQQDRQDFNVWGVCSQRTHVLSLLRLLSHVMPSMLPGTEDCIGTGRFSSLVIML